MFIKYLPHKLLVLLLELQMLKLENNIVLHKSEIF